MAYSTLREKIRAEKIEREARYTEFANMYRVAWDEGIKAASEIVPRPMLVTDSEGKPVDYVSEGPCGFAWVVVPGNTSFAKWLAKHNLASKAYPKGLQIWISSYSQSYARKLAHADAMARVLKGYGVNCYVRSRLD